MAGIDHVVTCSCGHPMMGHTYYDGWRCEKCDGVIVSRDGSDHAPTDNDTVTVRRDDLLAYMQSRGAINLGITREVRLAAALQQALIDTAPTVRYDPELGVPYWPDTSV